MERDRIVRGNVANVFQTSAVNSVERDSTYRVNVLRDNTRRYLRWRADGVPRGLFLRTSWQRTNEEDPVDRVKSKMCQGVERCC
jgi:hypothetical protein